jgi:glycosyltransferase involved in cell wall biosynthesis
MSEPLPASSANLAGGAGEVRATDAPPDQAPVSVLILTRNEEANLGECLESVGWATEAFVVDSLSTDHTVEIARRYGAQVYSRAFEGYARQRNWALDNLPFAHDWILMLDADERVPAPLAGEITRVVRRQDNTPAGFYLARRFFFQGRWLKHGGLYPTWLLRLFRRGRARIEQRAVNEHIIPEGEAGRLTQPFDHADRRPLSDWIAKHNRYADLEAEDYLHEKSRGYDHSLPARLWGSQAERKRWIKLRVWNRLPVGLRPFLLFFRNYVILAGFLDGRAGLTYHVLWSFWYPFLIGAKIAEKQRAAPAQAVPAEKKDPALVGQTQTRS